jgi:hypothetical protein
VATRSPTQTHSYWGKFSDATSLPSGDTRLQSGDTAYAEQEASLYVYDATAAAWEVLGNIAGTIAATEVAFGTGTDTIDGSADLTWNDGNKTLTVTGDANPALVIASVFDGAFLQVTPTTRELAITDPLNPTDATAVSPTDVAVSNGTQSGNVAAGQVSVTDTGSTNTLRASIPGGVATITSEDGSTVAQPLDLEIGELQINTDPGAVGEVLTSNGPGVAPTWQAGGGGGGITQLTQDVLAGPGSGSQAATVQGMGGATTKTHFVIEGGSYTTVQQAINAASDTDIILVGPKASGGSWGPVVFPAQKRLALVGLAPKVSEYPKIDSVTYSPTSGLNIVVNTVYVRGLFINGDYSASPAVTFGGTNLGRLRLQECYIYNNGTSGTVVSLNNSASSGGTQSTTYIDNCTIQTAAVLGTMVDHVAGYTVIKNNSILEGGLNAFKSSAGTVEIFDTQLQSNVATEAVIRVNGGLVSATSSRIVNENVAGYGAFINAAAPSNYFGANNTAFLVGGASPGASARCVTGVNATALYVYGQVVYGTPMPAANTVTVVTASSVLQEAATGDLSGNYPAPTVAKLQGRAVSATLPTAGQALVYVGSTWTPTTLATPVTSVTATSPLTSSGGTTPVIAITNPLPVANGGTGLTTTPIANGRLLIGNGTNYTLANLTAGTGITITNGAGSISIAATATAAPISTALNGSAANLSPTYVGSVYVPASITLAATSRARIGVSGANQSVKLELLDTSAVVKATFQNVSATGFVDALVTGTPTLAAGWYDILLTANTGGSTAFARGLYLV